MLDAITKRNISGETNRNKYANDPSGTAVVIDWKRVAMETEFGGRKRKGDAP